MAGSCAATSRRNGPISPVRPGPRPASRTASTLRLAPAVETLDELVAEGQGSLFDLAFIDADKGNYDNYYERALRLVRPGGLIAIDNVLWSGRVVDESDQEADTQAIRALNEKIAVDERVDLAMTPIADGVTLARVR